MFWNHIIARMMSISELKRQSIMSFVSKVVYTPFTFLSTMYFSHTLGSSVLGTYFLFIAYFSIIDMVSDGGLGRAAIKRISEGKEQNQYYSAFFVIRAVVTFVTIILLIIYKYYISNNETRLFLDWLILAQFFAFFFCVISKGVAGRGKIGVYAVGEFTSNVLRIIIQIFAVFLGYEINGLMGGFILGLFIGTIIQLKSFDLHFSKFKLIHIKRLLVFSFWLFLTSTGVMLYSYADVLMIDYFLDVQSVGIYRVAFQFTTIASLLTSAISTTLWPKISYWGKNGNRSSIEEALARAFTFSLLLALPVFAGGSLLGENILYSFYGAEFKSGYIALVFLLCAQVINVFQYFFTMYLGALDKQKEAFKATAIASILNIILNTFLIPLFGITGAAIATFVTLGLNAFLAMRMLSTIIDIKIERDGLYNIFKSTFIMSIFVFACKILFPLSRVWLMLMVIVIAIIIYSYLIFKFDKKIYDDFRDIYNKMSIPWPKI